MDWRGTSTQVRWNTNRSLVTPELSSPVTGNLAIQSVVCAPAVMVSPRNLWNMQNLRPHSKPTDSILFFFLMMLDTAKVSSSHCDQILCMLVGMGRHAGLP